VPREDLADALLASFPLQRVTRNGAATRSSVLTPEDTLRSPALASGKLVEHALALLDEQADLLSKLSGLFERHRREVAIIALLPLLEGP
jgi:hypothetical protein